MDDIKELREQAVEISELVEDTISHYCNENRVSGQRAWFFVSHLANAYLSQFPEELDLSLIHISEPTRPY